MFVPCSIALLIIAIAAVVALNAIHIPGLRYLTGAEPLQPPEPEPPDRDFAASDARGYVTPADWGDDRPRPELPATEEDAS